MYKIASAGPCRGRYFLVSARKYPKSRRGEALNAGCSRTRAALPYILLRCPACALASVCLRCPPSVCNARCPRWRRCAFLVHRSRHILRLPLTPPQAAGKLVAAATRSPSFSRHRRRSGRSPSVCAYAQPPPSKREARLLSITVR